MMESKTANLVTTEKESFFKNNENKQKCFYKCNLDGK